MALTGKLAALGSTTLAMAVAASVGWGAVQRQAPAPPRKPPAAALPAAGATDIVVCADADGMLRSQDAGGCGAAQKRIKLDHAETKVTDCDDCSAWEPLKRQEPPPANAYAALEDRVDRLNRSPLFTVVDKADNPIFSVGVERTKIYSGPRLLAQIDANEEGGAFTARSGDGLLATSFGIAGTQAGLAIAEGGQTRLSVGRQPAGNYSLKVMPQGGIIAGIGQSQAGTATMVIGTAGGDPRITMSAGEQGPNLRLLNVGGQIIASLRQAAEGAGLLVLTDVNGQDVVKMVVNDNRYGVVIAGPKIGFPLVTGSGLPGSYILGCAAGPSCHR